MRLLLVDDSTDDVFLIRLALRSMRDLHIVGHLEDGEEAIAYLQGSGRYRNRERHPFPDVVLLDLRMPMVDGFEVLSWIQQQHIPELIVIVLSGSTRECDMVKALDMGAHMYLVKESGFGNLRAILEALRAVGRDPRRRKQVMEKANGHLNEPVAH